MATDRLPDRDRPLLMKKREREVFSRGTVGLGLGLGTPAYAPSKPKCAKITQNRRL